MFYQPIHYQGCLTTTVCNIFFINSVLSSQNMKNYTHFLTALLICASSFCVNAQSNEYWEEKLKDCEVELPIKGTSKYDAADHKIAQKYENTVLIWLYFEKSLKKDSAFIPRRVYLVSELLQNGSRVEYIIPVEDHEAGINAPIFPEWKSKKNRFYLATCFDKVYQP